jgi:hypothetical protein
LYAGSLNNLHPLSSIVDAAVHGEFLPEGVFLLGLARKSSLAENITQMPNN